MRRTISDAGFSAVELSVVVLILVILAATAIPNFVAVEAAWALDSAGAEVAGQLSTARTNALKRNRQTWVLATTAASTIEVQAFDEDGNPETIGTPSQLPRAVTIAPPGNAPTLRIRFDSMGRPVDAIGVIAEQSIQVRHVRSQRLRSVTVTTTGRIVVN